jgi:hypothetical protein
VILSSNHQPSKEEPVTKASASVESSVCASANSTSLKVDDVTHSDRTKAAAEILINDKTTVATGPVFNEKSTVVAGSFLNDKMTGAAGPFRNDKTAGGPFQTGCKTPAAPQLFQAGVRTQNIISCY